MRPLIVAAAAALEMTGVTKVDLDAIEDKNPGIPLAYPPLFTDESLDGMPLQPFLEVKTSLDFVDFVATYDEFVQQYVARGSRGLPSPENFLREKLRLSKLDAVMLFGHLGRGRTPRRLRDMLMLLPRLGALAAYNYDAVGMHSTPTAFMVRVDGYNFGLNNSMPVTNYKPLVVPRQLIASSRGNLIDLPRSEGAIVRKYDALSLSYEWLRRRNRDEDSGLRLALQTLMWRTYPTRRKIMAGAVKSGPAPTGWKMALDMAEGFEFVERPYQHIKQVLVPNLMSNREFVKEFGQSPHHGRKVGRARREMWTNRIAQLRRIKVKEQQ